MLVIAVTNVVFLGLGFTGVRRGQGFVVKKVRFTRSALATTSALPTAAVDVGVF